MKLLRQSRLKKWEYLECFIEKGIIEKVKRGVYCSTDILDDEFYIFQMKNQNAIFSYNTTMYFHGETERTPHEIDVTGYNTQRFPKNIRVHYVKKENLNLGVTTVETPYGFRVKAYSLERIACDILKGRNTGVDKEQTNKFIRNVLKNKKVNISTIYKYAKKLKCVKQFEQVMEWII